MELLLNAQNKKLYFYVKNKKLPTWVSSKQVQKRNTYVSLRCIEGMASSDFSIGPKFSSIVIALEALNITGQLQATIGTLCVRRQVRSTDEDGCQLNFIVSPTYDVGDHVVSLFPTSFSSPPRFHFFVVFCSSLPTFFLLFVRCWHGFAVFIFQFSVYSFFFCLINVYFVCYSSLTV